MDKEKGVAPGQPGSTHKWIWFVGLWLAGVIAVGTVSFLLRWILLP